MGGADHVPHWATDRERDRFVNLTLQHMSDIADRLNDYPDQFEPLFGTREEEGQELTIVEEWCYGYLRGARLTDWSGLPAEQQAAFDSIALHGDEEKSAALEAFTAEQYFDSIDNIRPAALSLFDYWMDNPKEAPVKQPIKNEQKVGRNDPVRAAAEKNTSSAV